MGESEILVVEDEFLVAQRILGQLRAAGFNRLTHVQTGPEALAHVQDSPPDLILMDIQLEQSPWNGIETAQKIVALTTVPIVYLTSLTTNAIFEQALATGPAHFLTKPVTTIQLKRTLELALIRIPPLPQEAAPKTPSSYNFNGLIFLKVGHRKVSFSPDELYYLEAADSSCIFHTADGRKTFSHTLKAMLAQLEEGGFGSLFFRIHRSFAIGLRHLEEVSGNEVIVKGKPLPIGRSEDYQAIKKHLPSL